MSRRDKVDELKVQLGAFDQSVAGWINTDITPHLFIARIPFLPFLLCEAGVISFDRYVQHRRGVFCGLKYVNITKQLPFKDNSVKAFFSSHVLEHLYYDEVEKLIGEMYRCLQQNGVCRVAVPDLERIMGLYDRHDPRRFVFEMLEAKSRSCKKTAHCSAFTGPLLEKMFLVAGFREARVLSYRVGICPDIELLDNRPDESLFFEAIK